eukprot:TRINITY_DN81653_c0_g1_i1.p2 TRINITY_DN81653_c0_g1~~TRINITY_DN81653_c0_g1_i1.p2  ORF type:complete len:569 (-),score=191.87 TRINITY_DN81653_c0_g1_i1:52-1758(-)
MVRRSIVRAAGVAFLTQACLVAANVSGGGKAGFLTARSQGLEERISAVLQTLKTGGATEKIEKRMRQSAQALPKNSQGRYEHAAVRYLVHGYFAQQHGWLITGFGHQGPRHNASDVHNAGILKDKAPVLLEALLENRQSAHGLSLRDIAMMAATLETLIIDESTALLEVAYELNNVTTDEALSTEGLEEVLQSFMLFREVGVTEETADPEVHRFVKEEIQEHVVSGEDSFWANLDTFKNDAVRNFVFDNQHSLNAFAEKRFTFGSATQLAEKIAHEYGRWQNSECQMMKEELMSMDQKGFGRVPLSAFYSRPDTALYKFGESLEYLRAIGALDELFAKEPHVIVANFLAGPSNCVAGSEYYSVCCLSECETLMGELEGQVQAPTASAEVLLDLVSKMSSPTIDAPRKLPDAMVKRLYSIAEQQGGEVHLHGRFFGQWMHYAFPLECQNPHTPVSEEVMSPVHWEEKGHSATDEEKEQYLLKAAAAGDSSLWPVDDDEPFVPQWSEEEILPIYKRKSSGMSPRVLMRYGMQGMLLLAGLRAAYTHFASGMSVARDPSGLDAKTSKAHYV